MNPKQYDPYNFSVERSFDGSIIEPIATVDCPRCNYRIPVQKEYIDWETRYKEMEKVAKHYYDRTTIYLQKEREDYAYEYKLLKDKISAVKYIHNDRENHFKFMTDKLDRLKYRYNILRKERDNLASMLGLALDNFLSDLEAQNDSN